MTFVVLDTIQSKFSELAQEDDLGKIINFLKQKGIPVIGIQDKMHLQIILKTVNDKVINKIVNKKSY